MKKTQRGFTLIELLIVIAIIGILSSIGLVALNGARGKARDAQRESDLATYRTALLLYFDDNANTYPNVTTAENSETVGANLDAALVTTGKYMQRVPAAPATGCPGVTDYYYVSDNAASDQKYALWTNLESSGCADVYILNSGGYGGVYTPTASVSPDNVVCTTTAGKIGACASPNPTG